MDCNNTYCLRRPLNMSFDYKYWVFFSQHNNNLYFAVFINAISTTTIAWCRSLSGRLQLKCDGTQWRTGGEVKGKLANGVGSQYSSHYLGTWCIQHYYRWLRTPRLPVADWTDDPADLNGLVRFADKTKSGFCACAITFQLASKYSYHRGLNIKRLSVSYRGYGVCTVQSGMKMIWGICEVRWLNWCTKVGASIPGCGWACF